MDLENNRLMGVVADQFEEDLRSEGAELNKIHIRLYTHSIRGLMAMRNIEQGERMLFMPRKFIITYDDVLKSEFISKKAALL